MADNKTKVLITIPCLDNIHWKVVSTLISVLLNNKKYHLDTMINSMIGIAENRNAIVKEFLKTDFDYLVMIDSENPPPTNFLDLIELDKDVIGLPTPVNMNWMGVTNMVWNVFYDKGLVKSAGEGLERVYSVGTGCVIIKRRVLEAIEHPFTTVRDADDVRIIGTDANFCNKCRDKGFEIWTHWGYKCRHYKKIDYLSLI